MSTSQYNETRPIVAQRVLAVADGTTQTDLMDWGSDNFRIDALVATSTDVIDHALIVVIHSSADIPVGTVNIPAGAGYGTVPAVDVLAGLTSILRNGWAMTAAESVQVKLGFACYSGEIALVALGGVI